MRATTRDITLVGLFIASAIIVPIFFHALGLGPIFLPMFLPILIAGFLLDPFPAMAVGFLSPWISSFITSMPPLVPTAPLMCMEGLALAGVSSCLYRRHKRSLWASLVAAVLAERLVLTAAVFLVTPLFNLPPEMLSVAALTVSLPGIFLQLILVPIIVIAIERIHTKPLVNS